LAKEETYQLKWAKKKKQAKEKIKGKGAVA
jgi:hypothetical protein